jgi:DNA (cytosine-5)-methyltransferase 1
MKKISKNNDDYINDISLMGVEEWDENQINIDFPLLNENDECSPSWVSAVLHSTDVPLKIATLFSGIGAIEHALERLGVKNEIVFACDNDKFVKQSYFANYNISDEKWFDDIYDINGANFLGSIDILVGGSPCQSFSMIGKRMGLEDTRGTLFYEFARIVKESQPKIFIYENVKGLLTHDKGKTWQIMRCVFKELGYTFHSNVLNARDFGIPQNRERIFVVGFKENIEFDFPKPIVLNSTMQDFLEDNIQSKYYLPEKGVEFVTHVHNQQKRYTQINGNIALCQKANQQFNWHGDFVFEQKEDIDEKYFLSDKVKQYVLATGTKNFYSKPETDLRIARPIISTLHKMHRAGVDNYVTRQGRLRKLTPRECLRLMGFKDSFKQIVSDTQMYRQAGNSIVVDVLIALLKQINITKYVSEI